MLHTFLNLCFTFLFFLCFLRLNVKEMKIVHKIWLVKITIALTHVKLLDVKKITFVKSSNTWLLVVENLCQCLKRWVCLAVLLWALDIFFRQITSQNSYKSLFLGFRPFNWKILYYSVIFLDSPKNSHKCVILITLWSFFSK